MDSKSDLWKYSSSIEKQQKRHRLDDYSGITLKNLSLRYEESRTLCRKNFFPKVNIRL